MVNCRWIHPNCYGLKGVSLTPYWVMFLSIIVEVVGNTIFNIVMSLCQESKASDKEPSENVLNMVMVVENKSRESAGNQPVVMVHQPPQRSKGSQNHLALMLLEPNWLFSLLMMVYQLVALFYIIIHTREQSTDSEGDPLTSWAQYQITYIRLTNTGIVSSAAVNLYIYQTLNSLLGLDHILWSRSASTWEMIGLLSWKRKLTFVVIVVIPIVLMVVYVPIIVTHSIPMVVMYCWFILPIGCLVLSLAYLYGKCTSLSDWIFSSGDHQLSTKNVVALIVAKMVILCASILLLQMPLHYGTLLYAEWSKPPYEERCSDSYIAVIPIEFQLRDTHCYLTGIRSDLETALRFFTWI